jgi:hypothetical protein
MRLYTFTNYYLSSIQQAIQGAHAGFDMFVKYRTNYFAGMMMWDWAGNHKTMMCMNGGNNESLMGLVEFFDDINNPYPYAAFHEDGESLGGVLTSVAILLPAKIYDTAAAIRTTKLAEWGSLNYQQQPMHDSLYACSYILYEGDQPKEHLFTDWERDLVYLLNDFSLAR